MNLLVYQLITSLVRVRFKDGNEIRELKMPFLKRMIAILHSGYTGIKVAE